MTAQDDDRAQMRSTYGVPLIAILIALLTIVLNEVFILVETPRGQPLAAEYAPDPTPQLALLAVGVATVALTKLVGWYRRQSADG